MNKIIERVESYLDMHHRTEIVARYSYDLEPGDGLDYIVARGSHQAGGATVGRVMFDVLPVRRAGTPTSATVKNAGCPCQNLAYTLKEECDAH